MKKKKIIAALLAGAMSLSMLTGCSESSTSDTTENSYDIYDDTEDGGYTPLTPITPSPSDNTETQVAEPITNINTAAYSGIFGELQTGYDQTSGVEVVEGFVPYGWTMETAVNWNTADMSYPGQATVVFQSPDGQATVIYQTSSHYEFSWDSLGQMDEPVIDTVKRVKKQPYMTADEYISYFMDTYFSTDHTPLYQMEQPQELIDYVNGNLNTMIASTEQQLQMVNSVPGNTMGNDYTLAGAEATVGYRQDTLNYDGITYYTESMAVNYACEIFYDAQVYQLTFDSWDNDFVIMYAATSEEAFNEYYNYYKMIYENLAVMPRFVYLIKAYSDQLWAIRLDAQNTSNREFNDMLNDYSGATAADRFTESWCDVITERDSYQTLDGSVIKTPHDNGSLYQNGDQYYYGDPGSEPTGWTQLQAL